MSNELKCPDQNKKVVKRTFNFSNESYVWLLCEECKERISFSMWDNEEQIKMSTQ